MHARYTERHALRFLPLLALLSVSPSAIASSSPEPAIHLPSWSQQIALREGWLLKRHAMILDLMRRHNIDMWIVVNEEFHDDPLTAVHRATAPLYRQSRHFSFYRYRHVVAQDRDYRLRGRKRSHAFLKRKMIPNPLIRCSPGFTRSTIRSTSASPSNAQAWRANDQ